ncbi:signal peptidase I [Ruminococcus flavefaciens]|uniref:Signal peptidase I n=1 Tax=Ruminococcus flavefaciens TaxID=1265 RepID=A0A1M7M6C0_RUMFL|nr:signal peptidase I [Ruminococcus flavefaciens]SHM86261.1 signal peptidase I [Ruminococcus flavefaciens]
MDEKITTEQNKKPQSYKKAFAKMLLSTLCSLVVAAAVIVLICNFIFPVYRVTGSSMEPTLKKGQTILCNKSSDIKKGDVIAFYHNKKVLIKRVIATAGDVISISDNGTVELNGTNLAEPYVSKPSLGECDITFPFTVPDSRYFVIGDNRSTSVDSRSTAVGCVAEENIIGKVCMRVAPIGSFGKIK